MTPVAVGVATWLLTGSASAARTTAAGECPAARCQSLQGVVRGAGERAPIEGARVIVVPAWPRARPGAVRPRDPAVPEKPAWVRTATTDAEGGFTAADVPVARVRVVVIAEGFERFEWVVDVAKKRRRPVPLFPKPLAFNPYRTVVRTETEGETPDRDPTRRVLTREEIRSLPGSQGDPLRALQNLPGVGRAPAGLGLLVLRGAAPGRSRVYLGGHAVPRAFHILSLASVFPEGIIDELEFVPGNFDVAYGNATGGVVILEPRVGRRDGFHGYAEVDLAAASALVEGPVGRGSFVVAAQRGYVDGVVAIANRVSERVTGEQSTILLPSYYDYQGLFDYPVGDGATVGVRLLGSGDRIRGSQNDALFAGQTPFDFRSDFHRADFVFRKRHGKMRFLLTPSFRFQVDRFNSPASLTDQRRRDYIWGFRAELRHPLGRRVELLWGADGEFDLFDATSQIDSFAGDPTAPGVVPNTTMRFTGSETQVGAFAAADFDLGPVDLRPGVRVNGFTVRRRTAFSVDPRLVGRVTLSDAWALRGGVGLFSQARTPDNVQSFGLTGDLRSALGGSAQLPAVFARFNPTVSFQPLDLEITVRKSTHVSGGAQYEFGDGYRAEATVFWRDDDNAAPTRGLGGTGIPNFRSRTIGLELLLRKQLTKKVYGWLAYTLMRSRLVSEDDPTGQASRSFPSDFDQRHNFIALASYKLPKNWRIGGRFRVVTGYPLTPVVGAINTSFGNQPLFGPRNSDRLGVFHQLDFRVDKRWIVKRVTVTAYVDVQNVYNRENPEALLYTPDFTEEVGFVGVPIFPSLGVRVDY